jgi:transposase
MRQYRNGRSRLARNVGKQGEEDAAMAGHLIPDEIWQMIGPLLPKRPTHPHGGRPVIADRDVLTGIVFLLKTNLSWEDLPTEMGCGCGMTCLRRLREWQQAGVWDAIQDVLQAYLREARRMDWSRVQTRPLPKPDRYRAGLVETSESLDMTVPAGDRPAQDSASGLPARLSLTAK